MINNRGSFRLRKPIEISWSVPEQKTEGMGRILNISRSGLNFETDRLFAPDHGMTVRFKSAEISPLPSQGIIVWFRKVGKANEHLQCGIRFPQESTYSPAWIQWMEDNVLKLADTGDNKILNHYLSIEEQE